MNVVNHGVPFSVGVAVACSAFFAALLLIVVPVAAQTPTGGDTENVSRTVEVQPEAHDKEIEQRLVSILGATGWFIDPKATVNEGIVVLHGRTGEERRRDWAGELARKIEGVVAVVNKIELSAPSIWDLAPLREEARELGRGALSAIPLIVAAAVILLLSAIGSNLMRQFLLRSLDSRVRSRLLRSVAADIVSLSVLVLGVYLVLRVSGLTQLAFTVLGGTGLIGLVLGIAFRDITENFLASVVLSLQRPFREGDLVELAGNTGYVQCLTSRTTILMTLDGNQLQIPNATVFKSTIRNFTSNPKRREDFVIGIGYDDVVCQAQEAALRVLREHPAVLREPEPWVLVDDLGAATVNLRVYFWLDGEKHSWLKVRPSVIRLVNIALQEAVISLPDSAREIVFPEAVPIKMLEEGGRSAIKVPARSARGRETDAASIEAEAGLRSEADELQEQAYRSWTPDGGENLLESAESGNARSSKAAR